MKDAVAAQGDEIFSGSILRNARKQHVAGVTVFVLASGNKLFVRMIIHEANGATRKMKAGLVPVGINTPL